MICRSRGGLSVNEKKEKFASNDNNDDDAPDDDENVLSLPLTVLFIYGVLMLEGPNKCLKRLN